MSNDLENTTGANGMDEKKLMDYLGQKLNARDSHELEKLMADDAFFNDAMEGLEQFADKKTVTVSVTQLNDQLKKQLAKNKIRKEKRKLKEQPLTYFTIIILLILVVLCYVLVKKYMERNATPAPSQKITQVFTYPKK
jgi:flagellar biogenesis protein FliO